MNRLVREHYPVAKLPEDLREGFEEQSDVRVTVDAEGGPSEIPHATLQALFAKARQTFNTMEEIDQHVRALREEWS